MMNNEASSTNEDLYLYLEELVNIVENSVNTFGNQGVTEDMMYALSCLDATISAIIPLMENSDIDINVIPTLQDLHAKLYLYFREVSCIEAISKTVGRPKINISGEAIEGLRQLGMTWIKIAKIFEVSRWTIARRVKEMNLQETLGYSDIDDEEIQKIIMEYQQNHGENNGVSYIMGHFRSLGYCIQRSRIRECLLKVDPRTSFVRWGLLVSRRTYNVPWPNSLWHLDGHHSLIRWKLVIHGCIDGFSRKIIFLRCSDNNKADTVQGLFLSGINNASCGLWPSRIRVDYGVENVKVCDSMVTYRGPNRGSFIAGPSTHNQRIERLWREVYRCVSHYYYYIFYALEVALLDLENPLHLAMLHLIYLPRINASLNEFKNAFNNHPIRTAHNKTPNQLWTEGMTNPENPLSQNRIENIDNVQSNYGYDINGPSPFENSTNDVAVEPPILERLSEVATYVLRHTTARSNDTLGIELYEQAVRLATSYLEQNE